MGVLAMTSADHTPMRKPTPRMRDTCINAAKQMNARADGMEPPSGTASQQILLAG